MCYYGNCPTFSACEKSLWWPPSSHLGLIPEMTPLYCSHCHSYWELLLLLPVLPLGSRVVGMNTRIPFVWIVAAAATGNVNPPKVPPACPDSTSSMHPVHTYKWTWMLDPRSEFGKSKLWSTMYKLLIFPPQKRIHHHKTILTTSMDRSTKAWWRSAACRAVTSSREEMVAAAATTDGRYIRNLVSAKHEQEESLRVKCHCAHLYHTKQWTTTQWDVVAMQCR